MENPPLDVNLNKKEPAVWFKYKSFLEFCRDAMMTGWGYETTPKLSFISLLITCTWDDEVTYAQALRIDKYTYKSLYTQDNTHAHIDKK